MSVEAVEAGMEVMHDDPAAEIELSGPDSNSRLFNEAWAIGTVFATINAGAKHVEPELVEDINMLFLSVNSPSKFSPRIHCEVVSSEPVGQYCSLIAIAHLSHVLVFVGPRTRHAVVYEMGGRERHGHVHALFEGHIKTDTSGTRLFAAWLRKKLDLKARSTRRACTYVIKMVALVDESQSFEHYTCYMLKDMGQSHMRGCFAGFSPEEITPWLIAFREMRNDLTADKIIIAQDNMFKLGLAYYNSHFFPLPMSFLTLLTLMLQSGTHILDPQIVTRQPINRDRMEAYWGLIRLGAATKIERDDVLQCVCGNRKRQTDPLWDTDDEGIGEEYGLSTWMGPDGYREMALDQLRLDVREGISRARSAGMLMPQFGSRFAANNRQYYEYTGADIRGGNERRAQRVEPPSTPPRVPPHVRWDSNIPEAAQPRPLRQREAVEQFRFGLGVEVLSQACEVVIPHLEEEDI